MSRKDKKENLALEVRTPRRFSAEYKRDILQRLDALAGQPGKIGELLRAEGLYSSLIFRWRQQRDGALKDSKRGPKASSVAAENKRLKDRIEQLEEQLGVAEELTVAQGKAFALLQELSRKSAEKK